MERPPEDDKSKPKDKDEKPEAWTPAIESEEPASAAGRWLGQIVVIALALVVLGEAFFIAGRFPGKTQPAASSSEEGALAVESNPPGALVVVEGRERGVTPVKLSLAPGAHSLEVTRGDWRRTIPVTVQPGVHVSQHIHLPDPATAGVLRVTTEPGGARVTIDGSLRGVTPLTVSELAPGRHTVSVESASGSRTEDLTIEPGMTTLLAVPPAPRPAPVATGWIAVASPIEVHLFEGGNVLGTSRSERIMVPPGRHQLEIVNEALGFRSAHTVHVPPGAKVPVTISLPLGTLYINATPWAEVLVDGVYIGETPLANVSVPIGDHEIVFRHPQFGERRQRATVKVGTPTRVGVDLRR